MTCLGGCNCRCNRVLDYVRCPHCGGNMADHSHTCEGMERLLASIWTFQMILSDEQMKIIKNAGHSA